MIDQRKCREFQEQFPFLFNSSLSEQEAAALQDHLKECASCRSALEAERALFHTAVNSANSGLLDDHPDSRLLDKYVRSPEELSVAERDEVAAHINECNLCRKLTNKLEQLPKSLDALLEGDETPLIANLDTLDTAESVHTPKVTKITRPVWRPLVAFAAAAVIVLVVISQLQFDHPGPVASVEALFPATTRNVQAAVMFESDEELFVFNARVFIGPEEGCSYSLKLYWPEKDSVLYQADSVDEFDSLGFALFELQMKPGNYELLLYDIEGNDTLKLTTPFEVRLRQP